MGSACWRRSRACVGPGGRLLASTPDHPWSLRLRLGARAARAFEAHFEPRADHLRFFTRRTLAELLDAGGFEEIAMRARRGALLVSARRSMSCSARPGGASPGCVQRWRDGAEHDRLGELARGGRGRVKRTPLARSVAASASRSSTRRRRGRGAASRPSRRGSSSSGSVNVKISSVPMPSPRKTASMSILRERAGARDRRGRTTRAPATTATSRSRTIQPDVIEAGRTRCRDPTRRAASHALSRCASAATSATAARCASSTTPTPRSCSS